MRVRRTFIAVVAILLAGPVASAHAECISLGSSPSTTCSRFQQSAEIFAARVVSTAFVVEPSFQVRVTFEGIEHFKETRAASVMTFEANGEAWRFEPGQDVLVFTTERNGVWSNQCDPIRVVSDVQELQALRALRDRRAGGVLTLWTQRFGAEFARTIVVRQDSRIVAAADTRGFSRIDVGWRPSGHYTVDVFDSYGRPVTTKSIDVRGCELLQIDP